MKITITTTIDGINYCLNEHEETSNDEICRAMAHLDIIKLELMEMLKFDYEVYDTGEDKDEG